MLSQDEIDRLERYSVWRERQRYTDEQLWDRLNELQEESRFVQERIPEYYREGHSWLKSSNLWRGRWQKLLVRLDANRDVMKTIVWHLHRRNDPSIAQWVEDNSEPFFSWHS